MRSKKGFVFKAEWASWLLLVVLVLLLLLPLYPTHQLIAGRDSGVFLYSGWRILHGATPYKDFWDQKPPVIFFLNAFGLLLSGGARWGVWCIELVSLLLAAFLCYKLLSKAFGHLIGIIAIFLWLFTLGFIIDGGNFTTEYALPLQFACLLLAWNAEAKGNYSWRGPLTGGLAGILFYTQQNSIGVFAAILGYVVLTRGLKRNWKEMLRIVLLMLGGFLLVLFLVALAFLLRGALPDFWSAAFLYNFIYSAGPTLSDHLQSLYRGWLMLSTTDLTWFGLGGWIFALIALAFGRGKIADGFVPLLAIGLIDFPIEIVLVSLGGRLIPHYYITLLPVFSVFTAFFFSLLFRGIRAWLTDRSPRAIGIQLALAMVLILPMVYFKQIKDYLDITRAYYSDESHTWDVILYIRENTAPADTVLALQDEAYVNFATGRVSPSRYVYLYPLQTPRYTTPQMVTGFLNTLLANPPRLIVDKVDDGIQPDSFGATSSQITEMASALQSHYTLVKQYGPWKIYQYSP